MSIVKYLKPLGVKQERGDPKESVRGTFSLGWRPCVYTDKERDGGEGGGCGDRGADLLTSSERRRVARSSR